MNIHLMVSSMNKNLELKALRGKNLIDSVYSKSLGNGDRRETVGGKKIFYRFRRVVHGCLPSNKYYFLFFNNLII